MKTEQQTEQKQGRGHGHKLTKLQRHDLVKFVRQGLISGMHPRTVREAIQKQYNLGRGTADRYISQVRQEQLKEVGFFKHQVQEICQKALVEIVQKSGNDGAKVRAVQMLHNIFDIRVTPEDTKQAQQVFAQEAMQKMDSMSIQQLTEFAEAIRAGGDSLTPEMLLLGQADLEEDDRPKKRRRK